MAEATPAQKLADVVRSDIGRGLVLRPFSAGDKTHKLGDELSEDEVKGLGNLRVLQAQGRIHVYSKGARTEAKTGQAFVVHRGSGKYDVIEGVKINDEPLTKDQAEALAGVETVN